MPWVYILRGSTGRHYIGSAVDLDARFAQHLRGHTATTRRLGGQLEIVARKEVSSLSEARKLERSLKRKKNPKLAIYGDASTSLSMTKKDLFSGPFWFADGNRRYIRLRAEPSI